VIRVYKKQRPFVFEADIRSFFDSVDRERLLNEYVFPCLPDDSVNWLLRDAISQEIGNRDEIPRRYWDLFPDAGIPQGGSLSPLFANAYLSGFDAQMLGARLDLIRYADDFVVLCRTKEDAERAYEIAKRILEIELGLSLHPLGEAGKTRIAPVLDGFEFLGARFNGSRLTPSTKTFKRLEERIADAVELNDVPREKRTLPAAFSRVRRVYQGWISAHAHTDLASSLPKLDEKVDRCLAIVARKCGWKPGPPSGCLTRQQRDSSGVRLGREYLDDARATLDPRAIDVFRKYWTLEEESPSAIPSAQ